MTRLLDGWRESEITKSSGMPGTCLPACISAESRREPHSREKNALINKSSPLTRKKADAGMGIAFFLSPLPGIFYRPSHKSTSGGSCRS